MRFSNEPNENLRESSAIDTDGVLEEISQRVAKARINRTPLKIVGGDTKKFYGRLINGEILPVAAYRGITQYEPAELVMTARCGTSLSQIEETLFANGQMLAFEPPSFGPNATLGGVIAAGLGGPRRPYAGAARDAVLGVKIMTSSGEVLSFGGQVMKNVAGYDVSRLMTGALGTLGVLLEISVRVAPRAQSESSIGWQIGALEAHQKMIKLAQRPLPISAMAYDDGIMRVRLAGHPSAIDDAETDLAADCKLSNDYWHALKEQTLPFFQGAESLWRLSVAPASTTELAGDWLWDWGGACRWLRSEEPRERIRDVAHAAGGHASLFRHLADDTPFTPLGSVNSILHNRVKQIFDPHGIFNPGRMYAGL
ncbi:MAG: glycolate oxidase subunit GlcE [Proteobacteria bacterium]|nr:glycolate oxidase subunit GlcE [Pseudomonadota bacterium]